MICGNTWTYKFHGRVQNNKTSCEAQFGTDDSLKIKMKCLTYLNNLSDIDQTVAQCSVKAERCAVSSAGKNAELGNKGFERRFPFTLERAIFSLLPNKGLYILIRYRYQCIGVAVCLWVWVKVQRCGRQCRSVGILWRC